VSNFAQTLSRRRAKLFRSNFSVTEMPENSVGQQKFSYFGVIAIILIVMVALCWGLTHI
jgi:hypothetical protein